jgi:hypothetical protein
MKSNRLIIFLIVFIACGNENKKQEPRKFTIIDKLEEGEILKVTYDSNENYTSHSVFYLGAIKDTILLNDSLRFEDGENVPQKEYSGRFEPTIFVDTSKKLCYISNGFKYNRDAEGNETKGEPYKHFYANYPIIITNLSPDTMRIGSLQSVHFIQEVKLANNTWKAINEPWVSVCGVGLKAAYLPPNNMAVCKLIRYKGDTLAEMRLRYVLNNKFVFSNTFKDSISKEVFR